VLRAYAQAPLAQEHVTDCALRGSDSRFHRLRRFSKRLIKCAPKQSRHDGWQLCGDGDSHKRHGSRLNNGLAVLAVNKMLTFGQDSDGEVGFWFNTRGMRGKVQDEELESCRAPAGGGRAAGNGCREKPKRFLPARFCVSRERHGRQIRRP
jgi:hypothetical protein